jgi:subtilisin family serine protease
VHRKDYDRVVSRAEAHEPLPAWSVPPEGPPGIALPGDWPTELTREWAWGGSRGEGVRVCLVDSGVEASHPRVGAMERAVAVTIAEDGEAVVEEDEAGDVAGHGTACAGVVRSLAPACAISSVRVLGPKMKGSAKVLIGGLRWAVDEGFDLVNLSLSTSKRDVVEALHDIADRAYFRRTTIVASAHNMPVESYPWRFASVLSVGSHAGDDPLEFFYNPDPPVEFFARGLNVDVAWPPDGTLRTSGNSLATPHISGICALILGRHPRLTPFELKHVLYRTASNVAKGGA